MALYQIHEISKKTHLYIWELTEDLSELLALAQLSEDECGIYDSFSAYHRKREWLAIRALLNEIFAGKTHVTYNEMGKPFVNKGKHVSFSHCRKYVAILTSFHAPVGVDIELITNRVMAVKERILKPEELLSLKKDTEIQQVLVYWSLKEVLYKIARVGLLDFRKNLFLPAIEIDSKKEGIQGYIQKDGEKTAAELSYIMNDEWVVAWGIKKD